MPKVPNLISDQGFKHTWLKNQILERILSGVWQPGAKVPTQRQLMAEYSLSHATVSRALQELVRDGYIARAVRTGSRVLDRAATAGLRLHLLGGVPPGAAKGLHVFRDLLDAARALGLTVEVHEGLGQGGRARVLDGILQRRDRLGRATEGVVFPYFAGNRMHIDRLREVHAPYMVLDVPHPMPGYAIILRDHHAAARDLAERLLQTGHARERIGLVLGRHDENDPDPSQWEHAKAQGAIEALGGVDPAQAVRTFEASQAAGEQAAQELFERVPGLTAIYCDNDQKAAGVYKAAATRGWRVPRDLSVVFINRPTEDLEFPVAPTYAWAEPEGVGHAAAEALFDQLTGQAAAPLTRRLAMRFEAGASVAKPRN